MSSKKAKQLRREQMEGMPPKREFKFKPIYWKAPVILLVTAGIVYFVLALAGAFQGGGEYDDFAQCLTDEGMVMYGTDWCSACNSQKEMFGESFDFIEFVNCDFHKDECNELGVTGYPTWMLNDEQAGNRGSKAFDELAQLSGCSEPE